MKRVVVLGLFVAGFVGVSALVHAANERGEEATPEPAVETVVLDVQGMQSATTGEIPSGEEIEGATGVVPSEVDTAALRQAVVAKLAADPRGERLLGDHRCSDYGACSLWGNLTTATGDLLALYEREKAADGETYEDFALPAFEARTLTGQRVRSTDLVGRPAVVAFLAVHCSHSMDTFPILQELHRRYGAGGLQVVGVVVNSGPVEDVGGWVPHFAPQYAIWVHDDDPLGEVVGSHLVPTYLLVDADGKVRKKLVGFKDQETVLANLTVIQRTGG